MRIVLVHGAWGQAAHWGEIPNLLAGAGHEVVTVDLPSAGGSPSDPVLPGLDEYAAAVADALPQGERSVLVGHSMGGMVISATAERCPERVSQLIYVAAFLPKDGNSLLDLMQREGETIGAAVRPGPIPGTTRLDPEIARGILFHDLPVEAQDRALAALRIQPNAPQKDRPRLSAARFGQVPRDYILCRRDRVISAGLQAQMCRESPCRHLRELEAGHFPQLACAEKLADTILELLDASLSSGVRH